MIEAEARIIWIEAHCVVPITGKPVRLLPFQKDFIHKVFTPGILTAGLSLPRGNGKTSLLACIALSELFLNPHSPDITIAAVTLVQSSRPAGVFGIAKAMVLLNPDLLKQVKIIRGNTDPRIELRKRPGQMCCIAASNPDGLLGGSWSMAIVDEFGSEFWTPERWANIVQSCGKRGTDSRVIGISTPNSTRSAMYEMRQAYLSGRASKFMAWTEYSAPMDCALDDRTAWSSANPALDTFLAREALEQDLTDTPSYLFRMMRLGQWVETTDETWLGLEGANNFDATSIEIVFDSDLPTYVGVDKSAYGDSSAVVALQRDADKWLAKAYIFKPDGKKMIDHRAVKECIRTLTTIYTVKAIAYDDRYFVEGAQELLDEGLPMLNVPQNSQRMSPAYSELKRAITDRNFYHDNDSEYRAHILSAVSKPGNDNQDIMLSKSKSHIKIDAAVATALAISASGVLQPKYKPENYGIKWIDA